MIPTPQLLSKVANFIKSKEKNKYFCLFLLGEKAGLRVSESVNFNLSLKQKKNLYLIQGKNHKKRVVFIEQQVISELQKNNWKPQQTNRFSYAHFLQKVKKDLNISDNIELTPHTLRRCFATYQANNGMPLPILQQILGHVSIRTTALYWKSTQEPWEKVISNKWLNGKLPQEPSKSAESKPKEPINNIFIKNNPTNSTHKLLTNKNKLLQSKIEQLERQNNKHKKTINNLKTNLKKALNDKQKLIKQLIKVQQEKETLLKMVSIDLKKQQQNLSNKRQNNYELHEQLISQIQILTKN